MPFGVNKNSFNGFDGCFQTENFRVSWVLRYHGVKTIKLLRSIGLRYPIRDYQGMILMMTHEDALLV